MPSPAIHLRAPLLWLLAPLLGGLAAARLYPPPGTGLVPLAIGASAAGLVSLWLAGKAGQLAHVGWGLTLGVATALGGFVLLHVRQPHLHERSDRPPREVTVTIEVARFFPPLPKPGA